MLPHFREASPGAQKALHYCAQERTSYVDESSRFSRSSCAAQNCSPTRQAAPPCIHGVQRTRWPIRGPRRRYLTGGLQAWPSKEQGPSAHDESKNLGPLLDSVRPSQQGRLWHRERQKFRRAGSWDAAVAPSSTPVSTGRCHEPPACRQPRSAGRRHRLCPSLRPGESSTRSRGQLIDEFDSVAGPGVTANLHWSIFRVPDSVLDQDGDARANTKLLRLFGSRRTPAQGIAVLRLHQAALSHQRDDPLGHICWIENLGNLASDVHGVIGVSQVAWLTIQRAQTSPNSNGVSLGDGKVPGDLFVRVHDADVDVLVRNSVVLLTVTHPGINAGGFPMVNALASADMDRQDAQVPDTTSRTGVPRGYEPLRHQLL
ncbi:hypothetical protein SAMN05421803_11774 [Nocardiopsis flavescens]|uniref:Uncharacterized protein n=1 Tax=Nocardiopsis flavescens TaxID=758803 RepID=A0A1M6REN3_9ACTN|nr:hypothetical protein SAMN05421803_11774 [Nocardiopsis flavescens]